MCATMGVSCVIIVTLNGYVGNRESAYMYTFFFFGVNAYMYTTIAFATRILTLLMCHYIVPNLFCGYKYIFSFNGS